MFGDIFAPRPMPYQDFEEIELLSIKAQLIQKPILSSYTVCISEAQLAKIKLEIWQSIFVAILSKETLFTDKM